MFAVLRNFFAISLQIEIFPIHVNKFWKFEFAANLKFFSPRLQISTKNMYIVFEIELLFRELKLNVAIFARFFAFYPTMSNFGAEIDKINTNFSNFWQTVNFCVRKSLVFLVFFTNLSFDSPLIFSSNHAAYYSYEA